MPDPEQKGMGPIDYGTYSKEDLKEAFLAINSIAYPENHAALVAEFGKRNLRIPRKPRRGKPRKTKRGASAYIMGLGPLGILIVWAMVGLERNSMYLPGKRGGMTFTGTGLKLAVLAITILAVSSAYVMVKPQSIREKADHNFFLFLLFIAVAIWVCAVMKSRHT